MKRRGRPKKEERVQIGVRVLPQYAELVQSCLKRKGLEQGPYIETLITIADRQIPNRPRGLVFTARPIHPRNKKKLAAADGQK